MSMPQLKEYDGLIYTRYVGGNPIIYCWYIDYISVSIAYKSTEITCLCKYLLKSIERSKFVRWIFVYKL